MRRGSLLAEALFLLFADGRKETSAITIHVQRLSAPRPAYNSHRKQQNLKPTPYLRNGLWVENGFDLTSTAVCSLGRLYLKRILLALFADSNVSLLRLAHFFTLILLSFY